MECKNCGYQNEEKYCGRSGQKMHVERIRMTALLHDVVHTITHFEKAYLHTIRDLFISPAAAANV